MASREGFDLLDKWGRHNAWRRLKRGNLPPHYIWRDTFGSLLCKIRGHRPVTYAHLGYTSCRVCNKYVAPAEPEESHNE